MRSFSKTLRAISLVTIFCFVSTQIGWGATADGMGVSRVALNAEQLFLHHVQIPEYLGTISDMARGGRGTDDQTPRDGRSIVLIQNAHANYTGQQKIRELLRHLDSAYGFKTVFVEGAAQQLDPAILEYFPEQDRNRQIAEYLAQKGILNGAGLYLAEHPKGVTGLGIEDAKLYRANYEALKKVFNASPKIDQLLSKMETRLTTLFSKKASPELRRTLEDWQRFEKGRREFMPFVNRLQEQAKSVLGLDMKNAFSQLEWPQLVRLLALQEIESKLDDKVAAADRSRLVAFLKSKHVSTETIRIVEQVYGDAPALAATDYRAAFEMLLHEARPKGFQLKDFPAFTAFAAHRTLQQELDAPALFKEIERLFRMITDALAKTSDEKKLVGMHRDLALFSKLMRLELSRDEYSGVLERKLSPKMIVREPSAELDQLFDTAMDFYGFAGKREKSFYQTIDREMRGRKIEKAVVLTGGFHTQGIQDILKAQGAGYAVVTPHLSESSYSRLYKDAMLGISPSVIVSRGAGESISSEAASSSAAAFLDAAQPQQPAGVVSSLRGTDYRTEIQAGIAQISGVQDAGKLAAIMHVQQQFPGAIPESQPRSESRAKAEPEKLAGIRAEIRVNVETTFEKITLKLAEVSRDGFMFLMVATGLVAFFAVFLESLPLLGGGLSVLSLASWGRYATKKYIETTEREISDRGYRRLRELVEAQEEAHKVEVARQRSQSPVLDLIMTKAPKIPLASALALVSEAKAALDADGDFIVTHHLSEIIGHHPEERNTGRYYEGDSYQSPHGYHTPRVEETESVEVDDYSTESWTLERVAKPRSESRSADSGQVRLTPAEEKQSQKASHGGVATKLLLAVAMGMIPLTGKTMDGISEVANPSTAQTRSLGDIATAPAKTKPLSAISVFVRICNDKSMSRDEIYAAQSALEAVKDPAAVPELINALSGANSSFPAQKALRAIPDHSVTLALKSAFYSPNRDVAFNAFECLVWRGEVDEINDLSAVSRLREIYRHGDLDNSKAAARALLKISRTQYLIATGPSWLLGVSLFVGLFVFFARLNAGSKSSTPSRSSRGSRSFPGAYRGEDRDHAYDRAESGSHNSFIPLSLIASVGHDPHSLFVEHQFLLITGFFVFAGIVGGISGYLRSRVNASAKIQSLIIKKASGIPETRAWELVPQAARFLKLFGDFEVRRHEEPESVNVQVGSEDRSYAINGNSNDVVEDIRPVYESRPTGGFVCSWTVERPADVTANGERANISRSESRLTPEQEKKFQKAMRDIEPKFGEHTFFFFGQSRRAKAASVLGELKDPRALPKLMAVLAFDGSDMVNNNAVEAIRTIDDPSLMGQLSVQLQSDDYTSRKVAVAVLHALGNIEMLLVEVDSQYPDNREAAVVAMGERGSLYREDIPLLVKALKDPERGVRKFAAWSLGEKLDPGALPALMERFREDDSLEVLEMIANAFVMINNPDAFTVLYEVLKDQNPSVRRLASETIRKMRVYWKDYPVYRSELRLNEAQKKQPSEVVSDVAPVYENSSVEAWKKRRLADLRTFFKRNAVQEADFKIQDVLNSKILVMSVIGIPILFVEVLIALSAYDSPDFWVAFLTVPLGLYIVFCFLSLPVAGLVYLFRRLILPLIVTGRGHYNKALREITFARQRDPALDLILTQYPQFSFEDAQRCVGNPDVLRVMKMYPDSSFLSAVAIGVQEKLLSENNLTWLHLFIRKLGVNQFEHIDWAKSSINDLLAQIENLKKAGKDFRIIFRPSNSGYEGGDGEIISSTPNYGQIDGIYGYKHERAFVGGSLPSPQVLEIVAVEQSESRSESKLISEEERRVVSREAESVSAAAVALYDHMAFPDKDTPLSGKAWDPSRDVIVVLGNPIPNYGEYVFETIKELNYSGRIFVVGKGKGSDPEWKQITDQLITLDVDKKYGLADVMVVDEKDPSIHTGMNIATVAGILHGKGTQPWKEGDLGKVPVRIEKMPKHMILIQAPQGLRGSKRIFQHQWSGSKEPQGQGIAEPQFFTYALPSEIAKVHALLKEGDPRATSDVLRFNIATEPSAFKGVLQDVTRQAANLHDYSQPAKDVLALIAEDLTDAVSAAKSQVDQYLLRSEIIAIEEIAAFQKILKDDEGRAQHMVQVENYFRALSSGDFDYFLGRMPVETTGATKARYRKSLKALKDFFDKLSLQEQQALRLAIRFHDTGYSEGLNGTGHERRGSDIARKFLEPLPMAAEEKETIAAIVLKHMEAGSTYLGELRAKKFLEVPEGYKGCLSFGTLMPYLVLHVVADGASLDDRYNKLPLNQLETMTTWLAPEGLKRLADHYDQYRLEMVGRPNLQAPLLDNAQIKDLKAAVSKLFGAEESQLRKSLRDDLDIILGTVWICNHLIEHESGYGQYVKFMKFLAQLSQIPGSGDITIRTDLVKSESPELRKVAIRDVGALVLRAMMNEGWRDDMRVADVIRKLDGLPEGEIKDFFGIPIQRHGNEIELQVRAASQITGRSESRSTSLGQARLTPQEPLLDSTQQASTKVTGKQPAFAEVVSKSSRSESRMASGKVVPEDGLWTMQYLEPDETWTVDGPVATAWSPNGTMLWIGQTRKKHPQPLHGFDISSGSIRERVFDTPDVVEGFNALAVSPDGRYLASVTDTVSLEIAAITDSGLDLSVTQDNLTSGAASIAFSPDGRYLVAGAESSNEVTVFEIQKDGTGSIQELERVLNFRLTESLRHISVAFSKDGGHLFTCDMRGRFLALDFQKSLAMKGASAAFLYEGRVNPGVFSIAVSPNGRILNFVGGQAEKSGAILSFELKLDKNGRWKEDEFPRDAISSVNLATVFGKPVFSIAYHPSNRGLVLGGQKGGVASYQLGREDNDEAESQGTARLGSIAKPEAAEFKLMLKEAVIRSALFVVVFSLSAWGLLAVGLHWSFSAIVAFFIEKIVNSLARRYYLSIQTLTRGLRNNRISYGRASFAKDLGYRRSQESVLELRRALMDDTEAVVRSTAAESLGRLKDPRAVPGLLSAMQDSDKHVVASALEALVAMNDPLSVDALVEAAKSDAPLVSLGAKWVLSKMGKSSRSESREEDVELIDVPSIVVADNGVFLADDRQRLNAAVNEFFRVVEADPKHKPLNYVYAHQQETVDMGGGLFADLILNTGRDAYVQRTLAAKKEAEAKAAEKAKSTKGEQSADAPQFVGDGPMADVLKEGVMLEHSIPPGQKQCFFCHIDKASFIARIQFRGRDYLLKANPNSHGPHGMLLVEVAKSPQRLTGEFMTLFAGTIQALGNEYEGAYSEPAASASVYHRHGQIRRMKSSLLRNDPEALGMNQLGERDGVTVSELSQWPATAFSYDSADFDALGNVFGKVIGKFHGRNYPSNINMQNSNGKIQVVQYPRIANREKPQTLCPEKPDSYGRFGGTEIGGWFIFLKEEGFQFMIKSNRADPKAFQQRIRGALAETSVPRDEASKIVRAALAEGQPSKLGIANPSRSESREVLEGAATAGVVAATVEVLDVLTDPKRFSVQVQDPSPFRLIHQGTPADPIRIVFIMPRAYSQGSVKPTRFPVGLMSMASSLRDPEFLSKLAAKLPDFPTPSAGQLPSFDIKILDLQAESEDFDLQGYLKNADPDVVGISAVTQLFPAAGAVSEIAKKAVPKALRVIGGVHISAIAERENSSEFSNAMSDYGFQVAVIREGEETFSELLLRLFHHQAIDGIPGLVIREGEGKPLHWTPKFRADGEDRLLTLDDYGIPAKALDLLNLKGYDELVVKGEHRGIAGSFVTSRGCPYHCVFCAARAIFKRIVEHVSARRIFEELKYYAAHGITSHYVMDDNLCLSSAKIKELGNLVTESGLRVTFGAFAHANSINPDVAKDLRRAGCENIALGVESGDETLLQKIGKRTTISRIKSATQALQSAGINVKFFLLVGLPGQDWASIKKTAEVILEDRPNAIDVAVTTPYPGSALYGSGQVKVKNGVSIEQLVHIPPPQAKAKAAENPDEAGIEVLTYTDVMTSEEIARARDLINKLFLKKDDPIEVAKILKEIDDRIVENKRTEINKAREAVREAKRILDDGKYGRDEAAKKFQECFAAIRHAIGTGIRQLAKPSRAFRFQNVEVVAKAPVRLDMASGRGSDLFVVSMEQGGQVMNAAITLNGLKPIEVTVKRIPEHEIRIDSIDQNISATIKDLKLLDPSNAKDPLRLYKAALIEAGIIPESFEGNLADILKGLGGGLAVSGKVENIPPGSGLGISSILGITLIKALYEVSGRTIDDGELILKTVSLEHRLGSYGGWQDPVGGAFGGVKWITADPWDPVPHYKTLSLSSETLKELQSRIVLFYTGKPHFAGDILGKIITDYLLKEEPGYTAMQDAKAARDKMRDALRDGDVSRFGAVMNDYWDATVRQVGAEASNALIDKVLAGTKDLIEGGKASGAGGGGFFFLVAKPGKTDELKQRLREIFATDKHGQIYDFAFDAEGITTVKRPNPETPAKTFETDVSTGARSEMRDAVRDTWVGDFAEAFTTENPMELVQMAHSDFYWVRIAALTRLSRDWKAAQKQIPASMKRGPEWAEVKMVLDAYQRLGRETILKKIQESAREEALGTLKNNAWARVLEHEKMLGRDYVSVARWDDRDVELKNGKLLFKKKTNRTQTVRSIVLWELIADMALFSHEFSWSKSTPLEDALAYLSDVEGDIPLATSAATLDRSKYGEKVQKARSLSGAGNPDAIDRAWVEVAEFIASADPRKKGLNTGAVIVSLAGEVLGIGYNSEPSGQESDAVLMGEDIRQDDFTQNDKLYSPQHRTGGFAFDARDNRPNLRRSICAEQRAILAAVVAGKSLEGATLYASHSPCNQCVLTAFNAGMRKIRFGKDFHDQNAETIIRYLLDRSEAFDWRVSERVWGADAIRVRIATLLEDLSAVTNDAEFGKDSPEKRPALWESFEKYLSGVTAADLGALTAISSEMKKVVNDRVRQKPAGAEIPAWRVRSFYPRIIVKLDARIAQLSPEKKARSEIRLTPEQRTEVNAKGQRIANYLAVSEAYLPGEDRWAPVTLEGLKLSKDQKVLMMVLGTWDERPAYEAARIYRELEALGIEPTVLTSGLYGNKPGMYFDKNGVRLPEAVHYKNVLTAKGVPVRFTEDRSTDTGKNILFSKAILDQENFVPDVILVVQNPFLQRRAGLSFLRQYAGSKENFVATGPRLISYTPYVPDIATLGDEEAIQLLEIGVREIDSLQTYPAKGWTTFVDIPEDILADAADLKKILSEVGSETRVKDVREKNTSMASEEEKIVKRSEMRTVVENLTAVDRFALANGLDVDLKALREAKLSDRTLSAVAHHGVFDGKATTGEILQSVREVQEATGRLGIAEALKRFTEAAASNPDLMLAPSDSKGGLLVPVSSAPDIVQLARDVFGMVLNTGVRKTYLAEGLSEDTARSMLSVFSQVKDLKGKPILARLEIVPVMQGEMIRAVTSAGAAMANRLGMSPRDVLVLLEGSKYASVREKIAQTVIVSDLSGTTDLVAARDYLAMGAAMLNVRLDNDAWAILNQKVVDALKKRDGFFEVDRDALAGLAQILTQIFAQDRATATAA